MVRPERAALAGIQERRQALGVDLWQVPWQDLARNTHALEHSPTKSQIASPPQMDSKQLDSFASRETTAISVTSVKIGFSRKFRKREPAI
jgi:hypothetical protein